MDQGKISVREVYGLVLERARQLKETEPEGSDGYSELMWVVSQLERTNEIDYATVSGRQKDVSLEELAVEWLEERGLTTNDVLLNDEGFAYVMVENEIGTPGEDGYEVRKEKVFLPDNMQSLSWR